jgi:hypothetical protein
MIGCVAADEYEVVDVADDPYGPVGSSPPVAGPIGPAAPTPAAVTEVVTASRWTRAQKAAAKVVTADAPVSPVLVRAVIVGRARMPRAALEITAPNGAVIGHVVLPNTSRSFDPQQRFWLVGDPVPGSVVALVSEHRRQVILPGSTLKAGPAVGQEWSGVACRMLAWERPVPAVDAPAGFHAVFADQRRSVDSPEFARAVARFRTAAVTVPMVFFGFCFPYLFVIPLLIHRGYSMPVLLALPVVGGGVMTVWSAHCRRELGLEAELIEAGAARWDKEIAFTQSYWASMRRASVPWEGPLPAAAQ